MFNELFSNSAINIIDIFVAVAIGILSAVVTVLTSNSHEKGLTSRILYEKIYQPIFTFIEPDLYKSITHEKAIYYGEKILEVINQNSLYYYPSLRIYAERLSKSTDINYQNNFMTVCWSIDKYLDKYSRVIGAPIRSTAYRLNMNQYDSKIKLFFMLLINSLPQLILLFLSFYFFKRFIFV